jgi:hypothetical protein
MVALARFGYLAILAGLAALFWGPPESTAAERDYCADDAPNVVLYLDVTTVYDDIDKRTLIDGVGRIFETLQGGERFSIRTIEDTFANSRRLLDACVPICPGGFLGDMFSDCTEGAMIEDTKLLRRRIVESIARRLDATTDEWPNTEIIRTLALSAPEEYRKGRRNLAFIFSDLIENSQFLPGGEFLTMPDGAIIEKLSAAGLIPDLWEVEVRAFGVGRAGTPERPALTQDKLQKITGFWMKFFAACGATVTMQPNLTIN